MEDYYDQDNYERYHYIKRAVSEFALLEMLETNSKYKPITNMIETLLRNLDESELEITNGILKRFIKD